MSSPTVIEHQAAYVVLIVGSDNLPTAAIRVVHLRQRQAEIDGIAPENLFDRGSLERRPVTVSITLKVDVEAHESAIRLSSIGIRWPGQRVDRGHRAIDVARNRKM